MRLSENFIIPAQDYASQGNGILGIRDAGKTYTAIKAAEELLDCGIPIIVYDPVGVWKNLKFGTGKHKGYPVVVAGGEGSDIRLTPSNAVDIVRAAMKEGVSLVIDLYSPELINKSTWIRIVQETVDVLMYENKSYPMRHIFLEEAAEFIPQRLQPQHARVYASLERLARMGRNARLGMTIINQRAEEVNKAILEICAMVLLHKQVGKNSLKSIQQWLELRQLDKVPEIIKSLPTLQQGECWAIGMSDQPKRIQVSARNTFHPNPKKDNEPSAKIIKVDVSGFVEKLNKQLEPKQIKETKKPSGAAPLSAKADEQIQLLRKTNASLIERNKELEKTANNRLNALKSILKIVQAQSLEQIEAVAQHHTAKISESRPAAFIPNPQRTIKKEPTGSLGKSSRTILKFLATFPDRAFSKQQIGISTGYSPGSGGFNNSLSELNTLNMIIRDNGKIKVNSAINLHKYLGDFEPEEYSIHTYTNKLGKCEREIYEVLLKFPGNGYTKNDLAEMTETRYSPTSGGFNNSLSRLTTLELITRENGIIKLNPELIEML